jgi:hypothetical protein
MSGQGVRTAGEPSDDGDAAVTADDNVVGQILVAALNEEPA